MSFDDILEQALDMLRRRGRVSYRALKRQFNLDNEYLIDLKNEILYTQSDVVEDDDRGLIWNGTPPERNRDAPLETDREKTSKFVVGVVYSFRAANSNWLKYGMISPSIP